MNILLTIDVEDSLIEEIRSVSADITVIEPENQDRIRDVIGEVDIVFGVIDPHMLEHAPRLRWIQCSAAGVDGTLSPQLAASEVILTSAKGYVGVHLAEHAMALLLALTRGFGGAVRSSDWGEKWPILVLGAVFGLGFYAILGIFGMPVFFIWGYIRAVASAGAATFFTLITEVIGALLAKYYFWPRYGTQQWRQ